MMTKSDLVFIRFVQPIISAICSLCKLIKNSTNDKRILTDKAETCTYQTINLTMVLIRLVDLYEINDCLVLYISIQNGGKKYSYLMSDRISNDIISNKKYL